MRTKTIAKGRFHRLSLPADLATTARPLPPPLTDNLSIGNNSSAESDDNVSHESVGDEDMDDFVENTCLECDKGEGLLICCGIDCPVALHEKCISGEPKYDEGKFYCPYCWYKLLKARTREFRKKAMLARKDLDCFLKFNSEMACSDKENRNNEREKGNHMNVDGEVHNEAREVEEDHQHNSNGKKLPGSSDQSGEVEECEKTSGTNAREILADEEAMEQGKNDRVDGDDEKNEGTNVDEENTVFNDAFQGSPGAKSGTANTSELDRVIMEKEDQMNKGTPIANVEDSPKKLECHPHTLSTKETSKPIEEFAYSEKPKQPEIPDKKPVELTFAPEKRRRINWKPEEEEALREGVHKFSTTVNKNRPWRKILEFGRHIFDPSRNPTDLKDKWKNMARSHKN